jgi:hypothetical protein
VSRWYMVFRPEARSPTSRQWSALPCLLM